MTAKHPIPPLRDLPPGRLEQLKEHLLVEIRHASKPRLAVTSFPLPRVRFLVLAGAAVVVAAGAAVLALTLGGPTTSRVPVVPPGGRTVGPPPAYRSITLHFVRTGGAVHSIHVAVQAPIRDARLQLRVLRGLHAHIVYEQAGSMLDIASPKKGPQGTQALSTWSTVLRPGRWAGGCQHDRYKVTVSVNRSAGASHVPAMVTESAWFWCR